MPSARMIQRRRISHRTEVGVRRARRPHRL